MERDFKRPKAGDEYEIKERYDRGGWPVIHVLSVKGHTMKVQDMFRDGSTRHPDGHIQEPRDLHDDRGWPKLRKHWKWHKPVRKPPIRMDGKEKR